MEKVSNSINALVKSKHAQIWLALLSFTESSFFVIPPDILLIALLSFGAKKWKRLATITTISSVVGAVFGYFVGAFLFNSVGQPIISFYNLADEFAYVGEMYRHGTFWVVFLAAFTPIPFKVFVLSAGFFKVPFFLFLFAGIIGRSIRFFMVAWLSERYGATVAKRFLKNFKQITYLFLMVCLIALVIFWIF